MTLSVGTVILPNPNDTSLQDRLQVTYPSAPLAYVQTISDAQSLTNTQDLSPSYAGLLYFPINPHNCSDSTIPNNGIPPNGITLADLPFGFNLIAMVPLTNCTSDYLLQARRDQAEAAIVYNYTSVSNMPSPSLTNAFSIFDNPIYGITSQDAVPLLQNMVSYAGDMSTVPFGKNLTSLFDPTDYVRLSLTIDTGSGSSLPGLWLFLLVILAALGLIIASTSVSMHISQYRARRDLRRRIAAGEIDLESLGIKRLTVPKEMIDAMPIKIFGSSSFNQPARTIEKSATPRNSADGESAHSVSSPRSLSTLTKSAEDKSRDDSVQEQSVQPVPNTEACAICLDDYISDATPVRQLPCNHIFHPHCIDPFLTTRSSLCPLCKRSVLPKGFIPPTLQLTNATVARERRIRLMRERALRRQSAASDPATLENGDGAVELVNTNGITVPVVMNGIEESAPTQEEEDRELRRRPLYRRLFETVFPISTRSVDRTRPNVRIRRGL